MHKKILKLFEENVITRQPNLKKVEVDDQKLYKILASKPGDINIILARTVSIIKDNEPSKTKKELIDDILEVLDRSYASRLFVGIGLKSSYHLYKGFPVRYGERFSKLPDQGNEIELDREGLYQTWVTESTSARKIATVYDPSKGEPIGGLLVDSHVDDERIYFDINAVIRTCKITSDEIANYNLKAAQGKAISNKNIDFLSSETSYYNDIYEVVTDPNVVNVRVVDTWTWDDSSGQKLPQWKTAKDAKQDTNNQQQEIPEKVPEKPAQEEPKPIKTAEGEI